MVQLFYVAVVGIVFMGLHNRLETIVVALFGIVYVAVRTVGLQLTLMQRDFAIGVQRELNVIKAAIVPGFEMPRDGTYTEMKVQANAPIWFAMVGLAVISLICLANLFLAFAS